MSIRPLVVAFVLAPAVAASAETATFFFAPVGNSYLAFIAGDDPIVGKEIVAARIILDVEVTDGDAGNFFTDIGFPIEPFDGNEGGLALSGADLGWSGIGEFSFFESTTRFNGVFRAGRFGAETPGDGYEGTILDGSRIEFDYIPAPTSVLVFWIAPLAALRRRR